MSYPFLKENKRKLCQMYHIPLILFRLYVCFYFLMKSRLLALCNYIHGNSPSNSHSQNLSSCLALYQESSTP